MEDVTILLDISFILITLLTVGQLYLAAHKSQPVGIAVGLWMLAQMGIGLTGFYTHTQTIPPRFVLLVVPPVLCIVTLFVLPAGRKLMDGLDLGKLTLLHSVRLAVEIVLYYLFVAKAVPEIMTFEGRNLDIIAGLTAPIVYYFGFKKKILPRSSILLWNLIALGLLLNIVGLAILSAETPFQKFGFDQPNLAVTHFPYLWLPSVVVPLVLFSHVVVIRNELRKS